MHDEAGAGRFGLDPRPRLVLGRRRAAEMKRERQSLWLDGHARRRPQPAPLGDIRDDRRPRRRVRVRHDAAIAVDRLEPVDAVKGYPAGAQMVEQERRRASRYDSHTCETGRQPAK